MPRILRSKSFWIGAIAGTIVGPFVIKTVTGKLQPISNISVQK
jgi:hypothetical protein